jgi:hypothetical protein
MTRAEHGAYEPGDYAAESRIFHRDTGANRSRRYSEDEGAFLRRAFGFI